MLTTHLSSWEVFLDFQIAPEVFTTGKSLEKTDVFGFGYVLLEMKHFLKLGDKNPYLNQLIYQSRIKDANQRASIEQLEQIVSQWVSKWLS